MFKVIKNVFLRVNIPREGCKMFLFRSESNKIRIHEIKVRDGESFSFL